jgi:hypothetical protein
MQKEVVTSEHSAREAAEAQVNRYWLDGFNLLSQYRDASVTDIITEDWFRARMPSPECYDAWSKINFNEKIVVDVSDANYAKMSQIERRAFRLKEYNRWLWGVWVDRPDIKNIPPHKVQDARNLNPLAYSYQILSGTHYFMLNYMLVDTDKYDLGYGRPDYYRRDAMLFDIMDSVQNYPLEAGKSREGLIVFKPRGTHFTTNAMALILKNMLLPKMFKAIGSIDKEAKIASPAANFRKYYERLPEWTKQGHESTKDLTNQQFIFEFKKQIGQQQTFSSYIIKGSKPTLFETMRGNMVFSDEFNLIEYDVFSFMQKARGVLIGDDRRQKGFFLAGGVSDNFNANIEGFKTLVRYPKENRVFVLFNALENYQEVDECGWTPFAKLTVENKAERDSIHRMCLDRGDMTAYITHISQNPSSINDCFYQLTNDILNIDKINEHIIDVSGRMNNPYSKNGLKVDRGFMAPDFLTKNMQLYAKFMPADANLSGWYIYEHPQEIPLGKSLGNTYIAGSDNVDQHISADEAQKLMIGVGNKLSKSSMVIINTYTNTVAAMYLYRHGDPKLDYQQKLLGCIYYNCQVLVERNKPGEFNYFLYESDFKEHGLIAGTFAKYLMPTPKQYGIMAHGSRYGLDTTRTKAKLYQDYYVPFVKENYDKIFFLPLLNDIVNWNIADKRSPDTTMALLIATVAAKNRNFIQEMRQAYGDRGELMKIYETGRFYGGNKRLQGQTNRFIGSGIRQKPNW